ncbi:hypothetical protein [Kriegella aquimaris]|uniref:Uncharacterized protein n=1 Tax=Kriegella aquimaris TaxID=192904 RepID=A0A1G9TNQ7_9FLAO|nr:hypothetical protein [Kriegella aquimaris]SDM49054.1 hypothetical protein SAMN04488514_109131 [Kriegella aquimaris]
MEIFESNVFELVELVEGSTGNRAFFQLSRIGEQTILNKTLQFGKVSDGYVIQG